MSGTSDFASAAQSLAAAVLATTIDPADSIRLLSSLAVFAPTGVNDTSNVGMAMAAMQSASADLFRRAAVVALARASAMYQPSSYDDAANIRTAVCNLIDEEMLTAADQGEDATYLALKSLRTAVVNDLTRRGASLARITTFTCPAPLPSLVLANRLYQDAGRDNELVVQANCPHPAFMPVRFKALSQ